MEVTPFQYIKLNAQGPVLEVVIDRPAALNALNLAVFRELHEVVNQLKTWTGIHAIIITGSGTKSFVAGADISEFQQIPKGGAKSFLALGNRVLSEIENLPIPVIAAINGYALGGGLELAMACHLRIASETARMGMPEINLGILPGYGGSQRLPLLVGKSKALEMILTGEPIDAITALQSGLVHKIVPAADLLQAARDWASLLCRKPSIAVKNILKAIHYSETNSLADGISFEGDMFTICADSNDFKEGTAAFLEKRPPKFMGE
jgi:enoyl-CoA hydratase